jgi:hypothetical protein
MVSELENGDELSLTRARKEARRLLSVLVVPEKGTTKHDPN